MSEQTRYERFVERYASGQAPWDDPLPPPEVMALAAELAPGRALDLGCGYGRSAIYLAQHGWRADGVDFVPQAIAGAQARAAEAGVADRARFYVSSATDLSFLRGPYDLALDIGCAHSFDLDGLSAYHAELLRLLRPGALYVLFAHLRAPEAAGEDAQRWILEQTIYDLFRMGFSLERVEHGQTQVQDNPPWPSAWFWFRRSGPAVAL